MHQNQTMYVIWMKHAKRMYISRNVKKLSRISGLDLRRVIPITKYGYYEDDELVFTNEEVV